MHKLLRVQLKKCFGKEWETAEISAEVRKLIRMVDQSYGQFDDDYHLIEHVLDQSSKELAEANQDIRENHELIHSVTESIHDSIFYKDLSFRYIGCNNRFAALVGKPLGEIIGKDDFELFAPPYGDLFRQMDRSMLETMRPRTDHEWVKYPDGTQTLLLTTRSPLINAKGELFGLVGVSRDITREYHLKEEVKSQQAMLIQQSRLAAIGEMIGNIAHQWRQPLNTLGLIVQDVEDAYDFGELNGEYIQKMGIKAMEQINYMSQTIDDFRNFFSPSKEKKHFSLHETVMNTSDILTPGWKKHNITCTVAVPEDLVVDGYANEFSQVLFNLLTNAKDALVERQVEAPRIAITGSREGEKIRLSVSDNAGGISPEIHPKIFDPYFTTKEEGKGTGIGLYMAKIIVEEHMNGELLSSNSEEGALFTIVLSVLSADGGER